MRAVPMLLAVLAVAGCARAGGAREGDEQAVMGRDLAASLEVKVGGDAVRFALHVTNDGARPVQFTFPSSQRYDFVVESETGAEVWRWSAGRAFLQVVSSVALEPGETWDFEADWEAGERAGRYVAVGRVTSQGRSVEQRMMFDLP